jgi:lipoate-protein ligase A
MLSNLKHGLVIKAVEPLCPSLHLAVESCILKQNLEKTVGFIRTNKKSVVIGFNQFAKSECDLEKMKNDNITLIKRFSGGGAVYLDDGNCMFGYIKKDNFDNTKKEYENILISAINKTFGINVEVKGKNDILVDGKKIVGSAFKLHKENLLCHSCILVDCDMYGLQKYLTPNKLKLLSHHISSIDKRVINLKSFDNTKTRADLENEIENQFRNFTHYDRETLYVTEQSLLENNEIYEISKNIKNLSEKAKKENISNFNYPCRVHNKFNWGFCEIYVSIENNAIKDLVISTDCIDVDLPKNLKKILIGKTLYDLFSTVNTDYEQKTSDVLSLLKSVLLDF